MGTVTNSRTISWTLALVVTVMLGAVRPSTNAQVLSAGNGFYTVYVNSSGNVGAYTATTGDQHPSGGGLNVLFGNGSPGTTFNTIRSYTSNTDYSQGSGISGNAVVALSPFGTVEPIGSTGYRTTYNLTGGTATPDTLTIIQDVNVNGTAFDDSTVEVTTTVVNNGANSVDIGVRYLWDYQVASDDGPTFQSVNPNGPVRVTETEFANPGFTAYLIVDNDVNDDPPTFQIFGTVTGPPTVTPTPTAPDLLQFTSWSRATATVFDFTVNPELVVAVSAAGQINDTAVLIYYGATSDDALTIPAGGQVTVSSSLLLTPPGFDLPGIEAQPCTVSVPDPLPFHDECVTRDARYWFTHAYSEEADCATLLEALSANGGGIDLGYICLPVTFRNADAVVDEFDALIEALGLYYRGVRNTGEDDGSQNAKLKGSKLCKERKKLSQELIATTANLVLLGTDPANCDYNGEPFPSNILALATAAATGANVDDIKMWRSILKKFNRSGVGNDFVGNLVECTPFSKKKDLKRLGRDPTSQQTCPGKNDYCDSAQQLVSFPFTGKSDLSKGTNSLTSPSCAAGGAEVFYVIKPPEAAFGRGFLVSTDGSNFDTVISVYQGDCNGLTEIACNDDTEYWPTSELQFFTDGTSTYYIVAEGNQVVGNLKVKVTSF